MYSGRLVSASATKLNPSKATVTGSAGQRPILEVPPHGAGQAWSEGGRVSGGHSYAQAPSQILSRKGVSAAPKVPEGVRNGERTPILGTRAEEGAA